MIAHVHLYRGDPVKVRRVLPGNQEGGVQDRAEQASYEKNPLAFWLRPDRGEHQGPCWEIEEPYRPTHRYYDVRADMTLVLEPVA